MAAFIAKQPNGLYCRFSNVVDCLTHWNMTKKDYLNNITGTVHTREDGEDILENFLMPFSEVIERFVPNNMTQKEFEEILEMMNK